MLIGRDAEQKAIGDVLSAATTSRVGAVVLVTGEAGIGKSALLSAGARAAATLGFEVLEGCGDALGQARPFGPILDSIEHLEVVRSLRLGEFVRATPSSPFEVGPEHRAVLLERIVGLIEQQATERPTLLLLDDAHWADASTLMALSVLGRRTNEMQLVVLIGGRPTAHDSAFRRFTDALVHDSDRRSFECRPIELRPLDAAGAATLAEELIGAVPSADVVEMLARCGGNPLLVTELVGARIRSTASPDAAENDGAPLTSSFHGVIRSRMADLTGVDREVALMASLLGTRFRVSELAAVTGRHPTELLDIVSGLVEVRLLRDDGVALGFRHDLVREAVMNSIPPSLRIEMHRSIGEALRQLGAPLDRVAEHVALGVEPGVSAASGAITVLRDAAMEIAPRDPVAAVRLLRVAVGVCPARESRRDELLAALVDALVWSGSILDADEIATPLLDRQLDHDVERLLRSSLGRALLLLGRPTEALEHQVRLVALHDELGLTAAWPRALSGLCRLFAMDLDGALSDADCAVAEGRRSEDVMGEILGRCVEAFGRNMLGDSAGALEAATEAVRLADGTPDRDGHRLHPHLFRSLPLIALGRRRAAMASVREGRRLGESLGAMWAMGTYHFVTALAHWDSGAWDDLLAEIDAGLDESERNGTSIGQLWALAILGRVRLARGDLDGAARALERADELLAMAGAQLGLDWLFHSRALVAEADGRRTEGFELLRFAWDAAVGVQAEASLLLFGPDLARLAVAEEDRALAASVDRALAAIASSAPADALVAARALVVRSIVTADHRGLHAAASSFGDLGRPYEAARSLRWSAAAASRTDSALSSRLFDDAITAFESIGAIGDADEARAASMSSRRGAHPRRRPRIASGWESLTVTEIEIVTEICASRSNPQIAERLGISRRTVEAHLRSIFTKLEVRNRVELALMGVRRLG